MRLLGQKFSKSQATNRLRNAALKDLLKDFVIVASLDIQSFGQEFQDLSFLLRPFGSKLEEPNLVYAVAVVESLYVVFLQH